MKLSRIALFGLMAGLAAAAFAAGPAAPAGDRIPPAPAKVAEVPAPMPAKKYPRGRKAPDPKALAAKHAAAHARHGERNKHLPRATQPSYDVRAAGQALPAGDQGQCGDCYMYSTCRVASQAYIRASAGQLRYDNSFRFSAQFGLDCYPQLGGCNGGLESEVADVMKAKGWALESDYGPYRAAPGRCKSGVKTYKILDYVYCTPSQQEGMASTQDIKNAILQYGEVSTAIVADGSWDGYRGGVLPFERSNPNAVDHAVGIGGWDDSKDVPGTSQKGAFLVVNQWGDDWGESGCVWVGYGSHQIGTEAFSVTCAAAPPPPVPPGPPVPPPTTITSHGTVTIPAQTVTVGSWPFHSTVTVPAQAVPVTVTSDPAAKAQPKGLSFDVVFALMRLAADIKASGHGHLAADLAAVMTAIRSGSGQLAALEKLAEDLAGVGSDPAVLEDLARVAADLGLDVPPQSPLRGKGCCGK